MIEVLAGLLVALAVGVPQAWAERHGPWPLYVATWALVVAGVVGLFLFGDALLIDTDNPLLLVAYLVGILLAQRFATARWGSERFFRR